MDDEMEMNEKRVMTLDDWIRQSPLPRIEARMLLQKAGGYSRVQLITQGAEAIPADIFAWLISWVAESFMAVGLKSALMF